MSLKLFVSLQQAKEHSGVQRLVYFTLSHLTSMICLENSHSRVAGKSSSTRISVSALRMDTGVSANLNKSNQCTKTNQPPDSSFIFKASTLKRSPQTSIYL